MDRLLTSVIALRASIALYISGSPVLMIPCRVRHIGSYVEIVTLVQQDGGFQLAPAHRNDTFAKIKDVLTRFKTHVRLRI